MFRKLVEYFDNSPKLKHSQDFSKKVKVFSKECQGVCSFCDLFLATFDLFKAFFSCSWLFLDQNFCLWRQSYKLNYLPHEISFFCTSFSLTLTFPSHFLSYLNLFRVKNLRLRRLSYKENAVWKFPLKKVKIFPISPPYPKTRGSASADYNL